MPTSAAEVRAVQRIYGEKAKKVSVTLASPAAVIKGGDLIGTDGNGKAAQLFAAGANNVNSDANTRIAGIHIGDQVAANTAEQDWDIYLANDDLVIVLPIVADADNTPTTFAQSMVGKVMRLRRVQNDDANTNLRNLYVACHDENTAGTSPIVCIGVDPGTKRDTIALGRFKVRQGFQSLSN